MAERQRSQAGRQLPVSPSFQHCLPLKAWPSRGQKPTWPPAAMSGVVCQLHPHGCEDKPFLQVTLVPGRKICEPLPSPITPQHWGQGVKTRWQQNQKWRATDTCLRNTGRAASRGVCNVKNLQLKQGFYMHSAATWSALPVPEV